MNNPSCPVVHRLMRPVTILACLLLFSLSVPALPANDLGIVDGDDEASALSPDTIIEIIEGIIAKNGRRTGVLDTVDPRRSSARDLDVARRLKSLQLDLDVQGSDVRQTLKLLGEITSLNFVVSRKARRLLESENRQIDVSFRGLSIAQALNQVIGACSCEDIWVVVSRDYIR